MLLYFDIFDYPLNKKELALAIHPSFNMDEYIEELQASGLIDNVDEWYFIKGKKYQKRINEKSRSSHFYKKAKRYSTLINRFPFVRGVYVSGSLSKDWADNTTDVDYFIITSPQRLWICRTLLILFKKIFLLNSRKYFCLNYFIDTSSLEIEEKNIFTATEVCFLKPIINETLLTEFISTNSWTKEYYAQQPVMDTTNLIHKRDGRLKKIIEKILNGKFGEKLDIWSMKKTLFYWKNKFPEMGHSDFDINFKSKRTISKHHPSGFQKRVIEALDLRIKEFEIDAQISLK